MSESKPFVSLRVCGFLTLSAAIVGLILGLPNLTVESKKPQASERPMNTSNSSSWGEPTATRSSTLKRVANAAWAQPGDVNNAEEFMATLPSACFQTSASASRDGVVTTHVICSGNGKETDGLISVKNGVVTQVR